MHGSLLCIIGICAPSLKLNFSIGNPGLFPNLSTNYSFVFVVSHAVLNVFWELCFCDGIFYHAVNLDYLVTLTILVFCMSVGLG